MKKTTLRQAALKLAIVAIALIAPAVSWGQQSLPYSYGFEDNDLSTDGWTTQNPSGYDASKFKISTTAKQTGTYGFQFSSYDDNGAHTQYLISPELDASNGVVVQFSYRASNTSGTELFKVGYSTTNTDISSFTFGSQISTSSTSWTQSEEFSFPAGTKYVAIYYYSNWQYYLYVDDFTFNAPASCPKPTDLTATLTPGDGSVATLSWTKGGEEHDWVVEYGTDPNFTGAATVNSGFTTTGTNVSVELTGLTPEQTYYARVKANCGGGDESDWCSTPISFTPTDAYTITLNDQNTTTNLYIPILGNYVDWGNRSQFIIPATTLTNLQWGSISKITFYATQSSTTFTNDAFNFYMKEVPSTTFASTTFEDWDGMSTVYSGSVAISDNKMVITFDNPYTYQGGNLLIGSQQTAYNSTVSCDWVGVSQSGNNTALYQTANSSHSWSGSVTTQQFLPKLTIEYTPGEAPSCLPPTDLAATPSTTSAELSWTANSSETAWTIYYKKTTDENYTEVPNVTTNPYTLNGLTAATNYQYYVVANCAADDASDPSAVFPFTTECAVIPALGYSENFDTYTAGDNVLPICWSYINTTTYSSYQGYPKVYNSSANSASNCLYLYSYAYYFSGSTSYDPQPQYAILPEMDNLDGKQITLFAKGYNASSTLKVGRMTNPTDASTFALCQELTLTTSYQEFEVELTGTGNYIALMIDAATSSRTTNGVYVDDITVENVPTCRKPSALMLDNPSARTAHTATLKWTNGDENQTAWQISYSTVANFNPDEGTIVDVTTNPDTIEGLAQSTTYYAYVRANCGSEDGMSAWCINKATFTTLAGNNAPTGLAVPDITVSSSSAIATWNANAANELHQFYELYISNDATAPTAESTPSYITTDTSFTFTGLDPETEYYVWVRDDCGTDGYSAWLGSVSFTTQASCPKPVLNAITEFTAHTADVEWSNFTENTRYEVSYRTAAYFDGVTQEFGTNTTPTGWTMYTGLLNENGTATLVSSTYAWSFDRNNGVFDNHARVNIYGNYQKWLVTPDLTVPENGALTFDMALTVYSSSSSASPTAGSQADDKFVVLITTDGRATWEILRQWDNAGSEYVYDEITNAATGEHVTIDLSAFEGLDVQVAFYGESTVSGGDNNLHIDNVGVGVAVAAGEWETENVTENSLQLINLVAETPYDVKVAGYCDAAVGGESDTLTFTTAVACPAPTELSVVGDATTNSVDLTWTAGAVNQDNWQICLNNDEENLLDVVDATIEGTTVTYTLTGLTSGADYSVKVRANCGDMDGVSLQWTNTVNFTTEASCTEPTAFDIVENSLQAHQVQLSWTAGGEEVAWDIYYSNTNSAPVNGVTEPTNEAITANPYTLNGLDATTTYYVWVRAHCGDAAGQQSPWVGPVTFTTECEAISTFPWSEKFENYTAGNFNAICWVNEHISGSGTQIFKVYTSTNGNNSTHQLQLPDMSNGTQTKLQLPLMTLPNANYQFTIDVYRSASGTSYTSEGVRVFASSTGEIEGATELGFLYRNYTQSDGGVVGAENASGWYTYEFPIPFSGTCYIILRGENQYGSSTYMDNLTVEEIPSCARPSDLAKSDVTNHSATLTWTAGDPSQNNWQVAYSKTSFDPNTASFDINTVQTIDFTTSTTCTYRMDRLFDAASTYYLYIRANCGTATEPDYGPWSRNGISLTTSAAAPTPSAFTASNIASTKVDLVWTAGGGDYELSWDLYYVQSDDAPEAPTATTEATKTVTTLPTTEVPYELDDLTEESRYYIWVRANHTINSVTTHSAWVALTGNYFTTLATCSAQDPVVSNITHQNATVTWDGESQDGFTVKYRTSAGVSDNSLFSEDFEDETTFANWTFTSMNTANDIASGKAGCLADAKHNGDYGFRFSSFSTKTEGTYDQYLVSPELNVTGVLNFFYKKYNNNTETLQVGYSTTTDDYATAFTWIDLDLTTSWQQSEDITLPDNVKYIAFHYYANCQYYVYLDDINIWEPTHAGAWQTKAATDNTATITSLTAETKYDVKVVPDCDETQESTIVTFTTKSLFEKVIEANKWYAIASPMHNDGNNETLAGVNNLTSGTYDLYGYNEGDGTWEKPTTSLNRGKGYIYRRSEGTTLQFVGDANTGSVSVSLTSSCSDIDLKGFNLIGNPYPHAVAISQPHYTLNPNGTWTAHTSNNTIGGAEAFLVYSTYSPNTYYFSDVTPSTPSKGNTASAALAFTVSNGEYSDVAYARFDNGEGLPKIGHLAANAPMLSIPVEGRRYAVANVGSDCESFDMVLRGVSGTYTLSFSGNSSYCHLIDRVAGKDIDMLRQNYTFSSNGFDADRFTVKLSPDAQENAGSNFAYWNGNVWMVEGNGTLQVFDALGRQLLSQEISNSNFEIQNSLFPAAGVYVLRMGEKTQKIVVR